MKKVVIDSCVFVKLFLDEDHYSQTREFMKNISESDVPILVPSVFIYEVYYISQKYDVDLNFTSRLLNEYQEHNLKEIKLNSIIINKTKEIIATTSHPKSGFPSFYDASYHALAMLNNCDFITADKKHYDKTKQLGSVKLLEDIVSKNLTTA
jgi:predicted nucleic acid-binding protein